jgi:hypothetical protein
LVVVGSAVQIGKCLSSALASEMIIASDKQVLGSENAHNVVESPVVGISRSVGSYFRASERGLERLHY